jgi:hypothetical protein
LTRPPLSLTFSSSTLHFFLFETMVHASTLFLAVLAAVASTSAWARPVIAREPAGFKIDTPCLGLNYLFVSP